MKDITFPDEMFTLCSSERQKAGLMLSKSVREMKVEIKEGNNTRDDLKVLMELLMEENTQGLTVEDATTAIEQFFTVV